MSNFITSSERTQLNFGNASYWIGTLADLECVWNPKKAANEGDAEAVRKTLLPLLHKSLTLPVEAPWAFWLWEIVSCMTMLEACFNRKGKEVEIARSCLGVSQNEIILRMADLFEQDFISQVECARLILEKAEAHVRAYMESRDIPKMCRSRCSGFTSDGSSASANALPSAEESLSRVLLADDENRDAALQKQVLRDLRKLDFRGQEDSLVEGDASIAFTARSPRTDRLDSNISMLEQTLAIRYSEMM